MNELIDSSLPRSKEDISIRFCFVDGDTFIQPLTMNEIDGVKDLMDWFRDPKGAPVWTWHIPSVSKIHMLNRSHIMAIDVDGYIELGGKKTRWYQRIADKWRSFLFIHTMKRW